MLSQPKSVVWIASYPKSGNTWLRFLVCNLVFGPVRSAAEIAELAPDIHELPNLDEPPGQRVLMKTHYPFKSDHPLARFTAGAIYVVRDPADVMLSNYHYLKRSGELEGHGDTGFDRYVDEFMASHGDPRWLKMGMGAWDANLLSWMSGNQPFPVLSLRYEDVKADALGIARRLCQFLGLERSSQHVDDAVANSSFERMRDIEENDIRAERVGIFYKPYLRSPIDAGLRFMRKGRSGEGAKLLSVNQRRTFEAEFGALRRRLGYQ